MENRKPVLLAHDYDPEKHYVNGWFVSEKLDGQRAIWLPATRGLPVDRIPFANRAKDFRDHVATGLWSRYGKVIHAPAWFLDKFPQRNLDGELWGGRGTFQTLRSTVSKLQPVDYEWLNVKFYTFDSPSDKEFWRAGRIYETNYRYIFTGEISLPSSTPSYRTFEDFLLNHASDIAFNDVVLLHPQKRLSFGTGEYLAELDALLATVVSSGGEGLILRHYNLSWEPTRSSHLLKVKPEQYGNCVVEGWTHGKGKLAGMFGALKVRWNGLAFELSGFTNEERSLTNGWPKYFPSGLIIPFKYRELTDAGVPKEARYNREVSPSSR